MTCVSSEPPRTLLPCGTIEANSLYLLTSPLKASRSQKPRTSQARERPHSAGERGSHRRRPNERYVQARQDWLRKRAPVSAGETSLDKLTKLMISSFRNQFEGVSSDGAGRAPGSSQGVRELLERDVGVG